MPDVNLMVETPKPTEFRVPTSIGVVTVTYDRNAMTPDVASINGIGMRERLSRVLLSWDVTDGDEPLQPSPLTDDVWYEVVREGRTAARQLWEAEQERRRGLTEELAAQQPPLDPEPPSPDAPITFTHVRAVYRAAWLDILIKLHSDLIREIDGGLLDDFLGVSWRGRTSATSSSTAPSTTTKRRGSSTKSVAA